MPRIRSRIALKMCEKSGPWTELWSGGGPRCLPCPWCQFTSLSLQIAIPWQLINICIPASDKLTQNEKTREMCFFGAEVSAEKWSIKRKHLKLPYLWPIFLSSYQPQDEEKSIFATFQVITLEVFGSVQELCKDNMSKLFNICSTH